MDVLASPFVQRDASGLGFEADLHDVLIPVQLRSRLQLDHHGRPTHGSGDQESVIVATLIIPTGWSGCSSVRSSGPSASSVSSMR